MTATELGRLHTKLDAALLGDLELDGNDPFITYIADSIGPKMRHAHGTYVHNAAVLAKAKKAEAARKARENPPEPVCDCRNGAQSCPVHDVKAT